MTHRVDNDTTIIAADPGALTCFDTAARGCRPASIRVVEMGVDTGTTYVFGIESGSAACAVAELTQSYSANFGGSTSQVSSLTCRRTAVTGRGVTLTCSGQNVLIPATVTGETKTGG
jgi:hypothetical protein